MDTLTHRWRESVRKLKRVRVLQLVADGWTGVGAAEAVGVTQATVCAVRRRYRSDVTRELQVQELERRGRQRVSVATMGRVLARLGASLKAAKPTVGCPWPGWKRRRRLYELR